MSDELLEQAEKLIPADVRLISGCRDEQTSADVSNVASFKLPDPAGRAGGACTSAFLQVLYADHQDTAEDLTFEEVVLKVRDNLSENFSQIPQLSSSRPINIHEKFNIAPEGSEGTRRAVMIGINYEGQDGELSGCHNDVNNVSSHEPEVAFAECSCFGLFSSRTSNNILCNLYDTDVGIYSGSTWIRKGQHHHLDG